MVTGVTYVPDALRVRVKAIGSLSKDTTATSLPSQLPDSNGDLKPKAVAVSGESKDNPEWPYYSKEDKARDEAAGLPSPKIDSATGENGQYNLYCIIAIVCCVCCRCWEGEWYMYTR